MKRIGSTAQRLRELPYEKRVCRAEYYPHNFNFLPYLPPAAVAANAEKAMKEYVDIMHDVGLEVQVVVPEMDRGTPRFHSKMISPHPNVDQDLLPRYLEMAHEKGIIALGYYSINYCKPLKPIHPEWLMEMLDDGRPPSENLGWFCFNAPYRDWLTEYLIEFLDNMDLDGFYFDDLNWGSHDKGPWYPSCCCRYCEKLFHKETGLAIPRKVDFDSLDFRRFVNWRYEKFKDFIHHIFRGIRQKHPNAILDLQTYMEPTADWSLGHPLNPLHLEDFGGYIFNCTGRSLREPSFVAKELRATGTPFSVFRNQTDTLQGFGSAPYPDRFSTAVFAFSSIANGGQPCGIPFGDKPPVLQKDIMKWVFTELKKRADYIYGDTVKYVALHYSQQNRDFRPSELPRNRWKAHQGELGQKDTHGTYEMLNRSHILFDFILDEQLNYEMLSKYRVLFLSTSTCLSEKQCVEIRKYVKEGGTLIATHETSLFDELGRKRDNFALADVLGVDYKGPQEEGAAHPVIYVPQDQDIRKEFGYVVCFTGEESAVNVRIDANVEVLCTRSILKAEPPWKSGRPWGREPLDDFDPKKNYDSSDPTVTLHSYGKGQAIYITGDVGTAYMNNPYPPLKRFVDYLVKKMRSPIEIKAPEAIEVTAAHRSSRELMIHLVNNPTPLLPWRTGDNQDMTTFFALKEVNPIYNISIRFNDFKVKSARLPLQDSFLEVTGDPAEVVIPKVDLHEVLLVEVSD